MPGLQHMVLGALLEGKPLHGLSWAAATVASPAASWWQNEGFVVLALLGCICLVGLLGRTRLVGFVALHIASCGANLAMMLMVVIAHKPRFLWPLLPTHLLNSAFCLYVYGSWSTFSIGTVRDAVACPLRLLYVLVVMVFLQGAQVKLAVEEYRKWQSSRPGMAASHARFHCKSVDGILEGTVFGFVSSYALLRPRVTFDMGIAGHGEKLVWEPWQSAILEAVKWLSLLTAGLATLEVDHANSSSIRQQFALAQGPVRHLLFRTSEFACRLCTLMLFCICTSGMDMQWLAWVFVIADYFLGVFLIFSRGSEASGLLASLILGVPLLMVNVMQFANGRLSLQARRVTAVIVPVRTISLVAVLAFLYFQGQLAKLWTEVTTWVVSLAASVLSYYGLLLCYARRVGRGDDLFSAVERGAEARLRELLEGGAAAEIDRIGPEGYTPLHLAAKLGEVDCLRVLLEQGAELSKKATNRKMNTALHLAAMRPEPDGLKCLCDRAERGCAGEELQQLLAATNAAGDTALHVAAESTEPEKAARLLRASGSSRLLNAPNGLGETALHVAAKGHRVEVVRLLLQQGPSMDTSVTNLKGKTALDEAVSTSYNYDYLQEGLVVKMLRHGLAALGEEAEVRPRARPGGASAGSPTATAAGTAAAAAATCEVTASPGGRLPSGHAEDAVSAVGSLLSVPLLPVGEGPLTPRLSPGAGAEAGRCAPTFMLGNGVGAMGKAMSQQVLNHAEDSGQDSPSSPSQAPSLSNFVVVRELGRGGFGKVSLVVVTENGVEKEFAMKELPKDRDGRPAMVALAYREQNLLKTIRHPFMVDLYYAFEDSQNWYLVMELCRKGDLLRELQVHGKRGGVPGDRGLGLGYVARLMGEVLLALEHLHAASIIFRDLKVENVLLDDNYRAKVADFGLAKRVVDQAKMTHCGTTGYAAPEIMQGRHDYGAAVDLYAYGVMLWMLLSGGRGHDTGSRRPPETHRKLRDELGDADSRHPWASKEHGAIELIRALTSAQAADRPQAWAAVKGHRFFTVNLPPSMTVDALLTVREAFDPHGFSGP